MGHYPIKCVHCMQTIPMHERLLKLAPEEIASQSVNDVSDDLGFMDDGMNTDLFSDDGLQSVVEFKTVAQIKRMAAAVTEIRKDVEISGEYVNSEEYREALISEVKVQELKIGSSTYSGTMSKFYCPHCHKLINSQAGKIPIYLISLMGPSSSGKTVYITMLHWMLAGKSYKVPYGMLHFEAIGINRSEFHGYVNDIRSYNKLPGTTQEGLKDPYLLHVTYMGNHSEVTNKECLFGLVDMRGEMWNGENNEMLRKLHLPQFKAADGFLMMVDPLTLDGVFTKLSQQKMQGRTIENVSMNISTMNATILDIVRSEIGIIERPSTVVLTKSDILYNNASALGIGLGQPVIAPRFSPVVGSDFCDTYYNPLSRSTHDCIQYLSSGFADFLRQLFKQPYFTSVSALGNLVRIEGNLIDDWRRLNPVRVEEPIIYLLMQLNIIPPFHRHEYFYDAKAALNIWGKVYGLNWEPLLMPGQKPPKQEPVKKDKKGGWLFGGKKG